MTEGTISMMQNLQLQQRTGGRVGQKGGRGEEGGGEGGGEEGGDYLTLSHCRLYEICQDSCW